MQHPERGLEPVGQQDRVGVGEGGVGQVLGRRLCPSKAPCGGIGPDRQLK